MSEDLTVTYSGLSADEMRVIINDKRAVRLRHGCAITERRALDRTASELQDTCHKQAQRIAVLEQAVRQALEAMEEATDYTSCPSWSPSMTDECNAAIAALCEAMTAVSDTAHNIDTVILDALDRSGGDGLGLQKTQTGWWGRPKGKLTPVHYGSLREAIIAALGIESNAPR